MKGQQMIDQITVAGMPVVDVLNRATAEIEELKAENRRLKIALEAEKRQVFSAIKFGEEAVAEREAENEKLRAALEAIKMHQETLVKGHEAFKLSTTWLIANRALSSQGISGESK